MRARSASVLVVGGCAAAYSLLLRGAVLTWGATEQEAACRLPGDELLEDADGISTRAIDIDAPASAVWPLDRADGSAPERRRVHI
jgi:hypothetical protein